MTHQLVEEISFAAFSDCALTSLLSRGVGGVALREVFIPETVTEVASSAFDGCAALKRALSSNGRPPGCLNLLEVSLRSVRHVGDRAFKDCKALSFVELSPEVTLGRSSFKGCPWRPQI